MTPAILARHPNALRLASLVAITLLLGACQGKTQSSASSQGQSTSSVFGLNDTGTDFCRDVTGAPIACNQAPAQDGNQGRDHQPLTKQGEGPLGFDWTKLARNGTPLSIQNGNWETAIGLTDAERNAHENRGHQWSCIQDHRTGLVWEVKSDDNQAFNYFALRYAWYEPNDSLNGGDPGFAANDDCNGVSCTTQSYVAALNAARYCGLSNWRLPSNQELLSLVVTRQRDLVVNTAYFPNTANDQYWSHHTYLPAPERAWYLYFSDGSAGTSLKLQPNYLRLVAERKPRAATRDAAPNCLDNSPREAPLSRYQLLGDRVYDHNTGLEWLRCALGQSWDSNRNQCVPDGTATRFSWGEALQTAQATERAGRSDWRLPNKTELASLLDRSCSGPALNERAFPDSALAGIWSSTPTLSEAGYAWQVNSTQGNLISLAASEKLSVRLVRGPVAPPTTE